MNQKTNYGKKFIAALICLSMVLSSLISYAGENTGTGQTPVSEISQNQSTVLTNGASSANISNGQEIDANGNGTTETFIPATEPSLSNSPGSGEATTLEESGPTAQPAEDTTAITMKLSVLKLEGTQPKMEYYTGDTIQMEQEVTVSGTSANFPDAYVLVKIPKEYVTNKPNSSGASSLSEDPTITSTDTDWIIKYQYKKLAGGDQVSIPFDFKMDNGRTPNGYQLNVTQEIYNKNHELLKTNVFGPIKGKTVPYGILIYNETEEGGFPSPTDSTVVDPSNPSAVSMTVYIRDYNTDPAAGNFGGAIGPSRTFIKIPDEAVFKQEANPGWVYDSDTRIMYKDYTFIHGNESKNLLFVLEYPGVKFNKNIPITTWISMPDVDGNLPSTPRYTDVNMTRNLRLTPTLLTKYSKTTRGNWSFIKVESQKNSIINWRIQVTQASDKPFYIKEITDTPDPEIVMEDFTIIRSNSNVPIGPNKLYGTKKDGSETVIHENLVADTKYDIRGYTKYRLVFDNPIKYDKSVGTFYIDLTSKFNPEMWDANTLLYSRSYYNRSEITYGPDSANPSYTLKGQDYVRLSPYAPSYEVRSSIGRPTQYVNNTDYVRVEVGAYSFIDDGDSLKNPIIATLLPADGVEYIPEPIDYNGKTITPKLVNNFKGSGRPAIVLEGFGDLEPKARNIYLNYKVNFTKETKEGINLFETYIYSETAEANPIKWWHSTSTADILDMDNDGDKTEKVGYAKTQTTFIPPKELIGSIKISDDNINFGRSAYGADIGGDVFYKLRLENKTNSPITSAYAINVLPRKGDKTIVENTSNQFVNRGSQYDVFLNGPVVAPAGYTVLYSTESPSPGGSMSIKDQGFVPAAGINSWGDVTMIKIVMDQGSYIDPTKFVEFTYPARISGDAAIKEGDVANNSFAYSITGNSWSECLTAEAPIVKYHVDGKIFFDKNQDGIMDEGEPFLKNYNFKLTHVDSGTVYQGVTDSTGAYKATGLKRGNYVVSVDKKPADVISTIGVNAGDGKIVNQFNTADSRTDGFNLVPGNNKATKNAGVYRDKGNLEIVKTDEKGNPLANVVFELLDTVTGDKVTLTTDENGKASYIGLILDRTYKLTEKSAPAGYYVPGESTDITSTVGLMDIQKKLTNRLVKANIGVLVHETGKEGTVLPGAKVKLQKLKADGTPDGDPIVLTTNPEGKVLFTDVNYGNYQIIQETTVDGYIINSTPIDISVTTEGQSIQKKIPNDIIKANLTVNVVDKDDNNIKLKGAKVKLQPLDGSGNPVGSPVEETTDGDGKVNFNNLPYGNYKLTEVTSPEGYIIDTRPIDVAVTTIDPIEKTIQNEKIKANLLVNVVDKDNNTIKLEGAKVRLQKLDADGNPTGAPIEVNTDVNGKADFGKVPYGDYRITEVSTAEGYLVDTAPINISVKTNGENIEKTIKNEKIKADITVNVVDKDNNNIKLKGAKVKLQPVDGSGNPIGEPIEATTDGSGKVKFDKVPYGNYKITEVATIEGYIIDTTPIDVEVTTVDPIEKTIQNEKIKSNVTVNVVDKDDNTIKLKGAQVKLQQVDSSGNPVGTALVVSTGAEGKADFTNVPYGKYRVVEVVTIEGYVLNTTPQDVTVDTPGATIEKTIENEKIKADIIVNVVDKDDNNIKLEGAKVNLQKVDETGNPIGEPIEATTDASGKVKFEKLVYGNYKITEIQTIEGYLLSDGPLEVSVVNNGETQEKTIENEKIKSDVVVNVVEKDDNNIKLQGAKVKLQPVDKDGNPVGEPLEATTDANGQVKFEKVPYGEYQVVEVKSSEGYIIDSTPINVSVKNNGETIENTIENAKIKGRVEITVVDKDNHNISLNGSKIKVQKTDKSGNPIGDPIEVISDENGLVVLDNVGYGDYIITQITTKEGYQVATDNQKFSIKTPGEVVKIIIENTKLPLDPAKVTKVTKTGDEFNYFIPFALIALAFIAIGYIIVSRGSRAKN